MVLLTPQQLNAPPPLPTAMDVVTKEPHAVYRDETAQRAEQTHRENSRLTVPTSNLSLQSSAPETTAEAMNFAITTLGSEPTPAPQALCELWQII